MYRATMQSPNVQQLESTGDARDITKDGKQADGTWHVIAIAVTGKNLAFVILKKTIQHFSLFSKLIREMPFFWNSIFSKSS